MSNQTGTAQRLSVTPSEEIRHLQSEMARLTAHVARLTAQQSAPSSRNSTLSLTPWTRVQTASDRPSGAHLQMCSYHGRCTHNDANCRAQQPDSAGPSTATTTGASRCYFCRTRAHPTNRCDRPCPHCQKLRVHRASACPNRNSTLPAAAVVSASTQSSAFLPLPPKYRTLVNVNLSATPKTTGDVSVMASYRPTEGTPAPPARAINQGPPSGIPTDSTLEVIGHLESMNLIDSSSVTDAMGAVWSTDLAKKYPHLPWVLLNEPLEVEALTAADVVLSAPAALRILGSNVARRVLEFIANGTIRAPLVDKILLDGEPSSSAVDAVRRAVEGASRNVRPTAIVATSPTTMMMGAQTLAVIAQQQPVANAFGEPLRAINNVLNVTEGSPFPTSTVPWSPKIGVLREVYPCGGLVMDFPGEDPVSSNDNDVEE